MAQAASNLSSRERALARRRAMSTTGKAGITATTAANNPPAETAMAVSAATHPAAANVSSAVSTAPANSGRAASRARRQAMSTNGKKGIQSKDRSRTAVGTGVSPPFTPAPRQQTDVAEKQGCGCGCNGKKADDAEPAQVSTPRPATKQIMRKGKHQNSPRHCVNNVAATVNPGRRNRSPADACVPLKIAPVARHRMPHGKSAPVKPLRARL